MKNIKDMIDMMKSVEQLTNSKPERVKVNEDWFKSMVYDCGVTFVAGTPNTYSTFAGIPVEYDESIKSFEFVYEDDYSRMVRDVEERVNQSMRASPECFEIKRSNY